MLTTLIMIFHSLAAVSLIGFVLLQQGKGAEAGAGFGAGASGTFFGSRGSSNFLSRTTAILATVFFSTSLLLNYFLAQAHATDSGIPVASSSQKKDNTSLPEPATVQSDVPEVK